MFGRNFIDVLDKSSDEILRANLPRGELLDVARTLRQDIGGLVRGEMRLGRRGALFLEHTHAQDQSHTREMLMHRLPFSIRGFLDTDYPVVLDRSLDRLVSLIAASYILDRVVMDFQPEGPRDSPVRSIHNLEELSQKMVLVVGATAVGKDTIRSALVQDLHPELSTGQRVDRDTLSEKAKDIGIILPVKLTGRQRRADEADGVDYWFFDGREGRPPETRLLPISHGKHHLPYSYMYAGHMYGFALEDIQPSESGRETVIPGLRERLESDDTRMILCGGGTTPEAVHFKKIFPKATVIYLIPTPEEDGLLTMEREVISRWWGRSIGEMIHPIHSGMQRLEGSIREALNMGNIAPLASILEDPGIRRMHDVMSADQIAAAASIEEKARFRLIEVMPQVGQALMLAHGMDFTVVPNKRGQVELAVSQIRNVLRQRGVIEESLR